MLLHPDNFGSSPFAIFLPIRHALIQEDTVPVCVVGASSLPLVAASHQLPALGVDGGGGGQTAGAGEERTPAEP